MKTRIIIGITPFPPMFASDPRNAGTLYFSDGSEEFVEDVDVEIKEKNYSVDIVSVTEEEFDEIYL